MTVVDAYRIVTMASTLSYAILERPRPSQTAVLQDESGIHSLLHLADTEDDAARWLDAHAHRNARIVLACAPEPRLFTYLQDPGHGWLIVSGADLAAAGMTRAEFSICSYVSGDLLALEEDCDMPLFLKRLGDRASPGACASITPTQMPACAAGRPMWPARHGQQAGQPRPERSLHVALKRPRPPCVALRD